MIALFSGGMVSFVYARFIDGMVNFSGARFEGSTVDFGDAQFSGGTVDFRYVEDWSHPPTLTWKDTPPSGVKLPEQDPSEA
jgi:hypothetical protein